MLETCAAILCLLLESGIPGERGTVLVDCVHGRHIKKGHMCGHVSTDEVELTVAAHGRHGTKGHMCGHVSTDEAELTAVAHGRHGTKGHMCGHVSTDEA